MSNSNIKVVNAGTDAEAGFWVAVGDNALENSAFVLYEQVGVYLDGLTENDIDVYGVAISSTNTIAGFLTYVTNWIAAMTTPEQEDRLYFYAQLLHAFGYPDEAETALGAISGGGGVTDEQRFIDALIYG
jgi:hypothetical protein